MQEEAQQTSDEKQETVNEEPAVGSTSSDDWLDHEPGTIDDDDVGTDVPWPRE